MAIDFVRGNGGIADAVAGNEWRARTPSPVADGFGQTSYSFSLLIALGGQLAWRTDPARLPSGVSVAMEEVSRLDLRSRRRRGARCRERHRRRRASCGSCGRRVRLRPGPRPVKPRGRKCRMAVDRLFDLAYRTSSRRLKRRFRGAPEAAGGRSARRGLRPALRSNPLVASRRMHRVE